MTLDLNYKDAVINSNIPFEFYKPQLNSATPMIDALYIPAQAHRPIPSTNPNILKNHVKSVYLLFSDMPAVWAFEIDHPNVKIITNMREIRKSSPYIKHESSNNPGNCYKPNYDIPFKRTYSLKNALNFDQEYVGFLDDDITLDDDDFFNIRKAMTENVDIASFHVLDYPDVATIDHIERITLKKPSRVSIGGNCMFINTTTTNSFFPEAYNDDWFFILSQLETRKIVSLGFAKQRPYQPWLDEDRVAFEQFGDILIEGVKRNIHEGRQAFSGGIEYWSNVKTKYLDRIEKLQIEPLAKHFEKVLKLAHEVASDITAKSFVSFLESYEKERTHFKNY